MQAFTLPEPLPVEKNLAAMLSRGRPGQAEWSRFPSGEHFVHVSLSSTHACVAGRSFPPGDNLLMTALLCDTLRRNGAQEITLALPYFAYSRQDRQQLAGDPLSAGAIPTLLAAVGVKRIVTADIHSTLALEASPIPIESVSMLPDFAAVLRPKLRPAPFTVVAPDHASRIRAEGLTALLGGVPIAWIEKERTRFKGVTARGRSGELAGTTAVLIDDMLDTGGTIEAAVRMLKKEGFKEFHLAITHPIFSKGAVPLLRKLGFSSVVVGNTMPISSEAKRLRGFTVVDAAPRLAEAMA
ncbi:ribose-phosphate pyrophosphokinase [Candidatus Uhrbacteria bacterium]|nr:ribose-phosphate pyrophosphokinase [Candidatus Uhrbacteria bacterium]